MLFLLFIGCIPTLSYSQPIAERRIKLDPIRMTYEDLSNILSDLELLIKNANQNVVKESDYSSESVDVSIGSEQETVRFTGWQKIKNTPHLPNIGNSIRLNYSYIKAPISSIDITLVDAFREIKVTGSDYTQVNAISLALQDHLDRHTTIFGGIGFRMICAVIFLMSCSLLAPLLFHKHKNFHVIHFSMIIASNLIVFLLPWDVWIAGFSVYMGSASFIDRNINMISFIGVLISLVPLLFAAFRFLKYKSST